MLKVYFGSDRKAAVDAAFTEAKKGDSTINTIDENSFTPGQFVDLTTSTSLFGETGVYVIDTPSSDNDFSAECMDYLAEMAESPNQFFIIEGTLLAPVKKKFAKHAETIEEFSADKPERFNTFSMADALARKDKKSLWVMVQEAQLVGIREEETIGILWWQLKSIRLAAVTNSATEAGMKDYPYKKAKQALNKFSVEDVNRLSHSLLSLYHDGHKGIRDIKLALEKWVLTI